MSRPVWGCRRYSCRSSSYLQGALLLTAGTWLPGRSASVGSPYSPVFQEMWNEGFMWKFLISKCFQLTFSLKKLFIKAKQNKSVDQMQPASTVLVHSSLHDFARALGSRKRPGLGPSHRCGGSICTCSSHGAAQSQVSARQKRSVTHSEELRNQALWDFFLIWIHIYLNITVLQAKYFKYGRYK